MDFSAFISLENKINKNYGIAYERFPLTTAALDQKLRDHLKGRNTSLKKAWGSLQSTSNAKWAYQNIFNFATYSNIYSEARRAYIGLPKFPEVEKALAKTLKNNGIEVIWQFKSQRHSVWELIKGNIATLENCIADAYAVPAFVREIPRRGFENILSDQEFMNKFESQLRSDIAKMSKLITRLGLQVIFLQDDSYFTTRLLALAARQAGVPYIVLAHGYIQNPTLDSIAPIYGDALLVWTEQQRRDLRAVLNEDQASRVHYFGYPKTVETNSETQARELLFVLEPINKLNGKVDARELIQTIVSVAKQSGWGICLRPHPGDIKRRYRMTFEGWLNEEGVRVGTASLEEDLAKCAVVVGTNSSALVEAAMKGLPTFQIREAKTFEFEGVDCVDVGELRKILCKADNGSHQPVGKLPSLADRIPEVLDFFVSQ